MIVDTLLLKLYISYKQQKSRIIKLIQVNEKELAIQYRVLMYPITIKEEHPYQRNLQHDNIALSLEKRGIKCTEIKSVGKQIISNETIIEFVIRFAKVQKQNRNEIAKINYI